MLLYGQAKLGTKTGREGGGGIANLAAADAKTSEPKRTRGNKTKHTVHIRRRERAVLGEGRELREKTREIIEAMTQVLDALRATTTSP